MAPRNKSNGFLPEVKVLKPLEDKLAEWKARKESAGLNWREVSATALRSAIAVCLANGYHLTFAPAAGNFGLCIKLWNGGKNRVEYAFDAETAEDLLVGLVGLLGSDSEDTFAVMAGGKE